VKTAISKGSRAILPMHIYGQPADMYPINETARRYGLKVLEDAAQAHGALYYIREGRAVHWETPPPGVSTLERTSGPSEMAGP